MRRFPWFEIGLAVILLAISLYAALSDGQNLSWRWFTRDDAYYYFKVAQNISEGHGSTFDGLNLSNGYHPLWMLVCVPIFALARFDLILPLRVLLIVMSCLSIATAILLYRLLGKIFHPVIGALAAVYWAFNYDIVMRVYQQGLETGLAAFFVVLLLYRLYVFERSWRQAPVRAHQLAGLGLIALLTAFSRLDLIFLAGLAGLWVVFRKSALRYFLPLDIAILLVSVLLAFLLRLSLKEYYAFNEAAITMIAVSWLVKIPLAYFLRLYEAPTLANAARLLQRLLLFLAVGSAATAGLMLALAGLRHFEGFPRITLFYDLILTALGFGLTRLGAAGLRNQTGSLETAAPLAQIQQNWRSWLRDGLAYYGVLAAGMSLYLLFNKLHFGTSSPVSGQIKRWWGSLPGRVYGGSPLDGFSFFGLSYEGDANTWHPLSSWLGSLAERLYQTGLITGLVDTSRYLILLALLALALYSVLFIDRHKGRVSIVQLGILPLFASTWLQVLSYNAFGYSASKEWYWIAQPIVILLAGGLLSGMLLQRLGRLRFAHRAAWLLVACYAVSLLIPFWQQVRANMTYGEWQPTDPNNDIAAFLEQHTEPGSLIGLTGGGNAGYFVRERTVMNMDGLINSYAYFQLLKEREAGPYLAGEGMDYVLANPLILEQLPYRGQFTPYLEPTELFYGGKNLMRFRAP